MASSQGPKAASTPASVVAIKEPHANDSQCHYIYSDQEIISRVRKVFALADPRFNLTLYLTTHTESIRRVDCEYLYVGSYYDDRVPDSDALVSLTSTGQIKNFPLCCFTWDCASLCTPASFQSNRSP
jgi:hypothetical protein